MKTKNALLTFAALSTFAFVATASTFASEETVVDTTSTGITVPTETPASASIYEKLTKSQKSDLRTSIRQNLDAVAGNWKSFHTDDGYIKKYIRTDLTASEKKTLQKTLKQFRTDARASYADKLKELKTRFSDTAPDLTVIKTEINATIDSQIASLRDVVTPYVATDKNDAFTKFLADRSTTMKANADLRLQNIQTRLTLKKSHK